MLLHIGIDTVALNGQGFEVFVENGQSVKKGDLLMKIDVSYLTEHGTVSLLVGSLHRSERKPESETACRG